MNLFLLHKISGAEQISFYIKVVEIAKKLNFNPNWLMGVIDVESAGTFKPNIQNPTTGATGLIQFMPATAKGLGTTISALKAMSATQQLYYVEKHLTPYLRNLKNPRFIDVYLAVLLPSFVGKNYDTVIPKWVSDANPLFRVTGKSNYTIRDVENYYKSKYPILFKIEDAINTAVDATIDVIEDTTEIVSKKKNWLIVSIIITSIVVAIIVYNNYSNQKTT